MTRICWFFGISKAGFYKHLQLEQRREKQSEAVLQSVHRYRSRQPNVGGRKIWRMLASDHVKMGRDRLFRLLRHHGMLSILYKKRKSYSKGPRQEQIPNLLKAETISFPGQAIVTDITYIQTLEGMAYVNVYLDLYSRKILSVKMSRSLHASSSMESLREALSKLKVTTGVIHHSDHGSQYSSKAYQDILRKAGLRISKTGSGKCYDNAVVERFHNTLKHEFGLNRIQKSYKQAEQAVLDAVSIYNHERLHASLGFQTPAKVFDEAA